MARLRVYLDELIDAHDVAKLLGLTHPNNVYVYQQRYSDMPKPILDLGHGRVKLWRRPEIERWQRQREDRRK